MNNTAGTHDVTHRIHEGKCLNCDFYGTGANPPPVPYSPRINREMNMKQEIKYKAVEYGEKNNLEEEDVAYFMTLMDAIYELGWKEKAEQMLRAMKDYVPKNK